MDHYQDSTQNDADRMLAGSAMHFDYASRSGPDSPMLHDGAYPDPYDTIAFEVGSMLQVNPDRFVNTAIHFAKQWMDGLDSQVELTTTFGIITNEAIGNESNLGSLDDSVLSVLSRFLRDNSTALAAPGADGAQLRMAFMEAAYWMLAQQAPGTETDWTPSVLLSGVLCQARTLAQKLTVQDKAAGKSTTLPPRSHECSAPECNGRSFNRLADLDRHTKNVHAAEAQRKGYLCDYRKYPRHKTPFFRQDHFRGHLRDVHKEDLYRRSFEPDARWWGGGRSRRAVFGGWWRCNRCLQRVDTAEKGYTCPACGTSCESPRVEYRLEHA